jgi:hypothetical protein
MPCITKDELKRETAAKHILSTQLTTAKDELKREIAAKNAAYT